MSFKRVLYENYRLITAQFRSKPDFLIIGAQKSGSTSLYDYMVQHPDINKARRKEVHYFSNLFGRGEVWYRSNFSYSFRGRLNGEATPYYIFHPLAPQRIFSYRSDMKLVLLLREPVERALSHYNHAVKHGFESRPIEEVFSKKSIESTYLDQETEKIKNDHSYRSIDHQEMSYLPRGLYSEQIDRYLEYFSLEQILILDSQDFFLAPQQMLDKVFRFLGVDEGFTPEDLSIKNKGSYSLNLKDKKISQIKEDLREFYSEPNKVLSRKYGVSF